ncbi:type II secretion system F family protein [Sandaracinus amylolyticus]|uniref:type II secretion system F family protein n=1 Tax=Sandaracinus amylolyticus TaxID=927083 RepID=UPI001F3CE19F|nr:type II secretion system F family protein [Sandaracinus amylolyticus]UJR82144.1 Type II/IV secretion system protein TadC, associated with Flp pilus assembly [Sandaracinus amylolyticus]
MSEIAAAPWLPWAALAMLGVGLFGATLVVSFVPAVASPSLGPRGAQRQRAKSGGPFGALEPMVRVVAGWIALLPPAEWRGRVEADLLRSGYWLGLTADEVAAMSALYAVGLGVAGTWLTVRFGWSPLVPVLFVTIGAAHPFSQLRDATARRQKEIERRLPEAVDLLSLCMGAGLDFPSSLRRLILDGLPKGTPTADELGRILDELELGHTRAKALTGFADRVPTRPVRDFVGAIVQAEEKGTPLAEILKIQARVLRMRRSVLAEEAAARAAMQLMIPLVLIFVAIMLLVLGPVAITVMEIGNV